MQGLAGGNDVTRLLEVLVVLYYLGKVGVSVNCHVELQYYHDAVIRAAFALRSSTSCLLVNRATQLKIWW